jgi:hypothetical protein
MSSFDEFVKKNTTWLENEYIAGAVTLFLIIYANRAAPILPSFIEKMFENYIFKIIMCFLVVYIFSKNASVALASTMALIIAFMLLDKMGPTTKENMEQVEPDENKSNDLFADLANLINDALNFVTSTDGQIAVDETTKAVQEGQLHPADAEMIINKIILAEEEGVSPLVAISEKGAREMESIARAVEEGKIGSEEGQRLAAQIVIQENTLNLNQEQLPTAEQEKQILAEEVIKQQQEIENNTGTKMTQIQLRQLCAQIELDYYNKKMNEMSQIVGLTEFSGFDDFAPLYEDF